MFLPRNRPVVSCPLHSLPKAEWTKERRNALSAAATVAPFGVAKDTAAAAPPPREVQRKSNVNRSSGAKSTRDSGGWFITKGYPLYFYKKKINCVPLQFLVSFDRYSLRPQIIAMHLIVYNQKRGGRNGVYPRPVQLLSNISTSEYSE